MDQGKDVKKKEEVCEAKAMPRQPDHPPPPGVRLAKRLAADVDEAMYGAIIDAAKRNAVAADVAAVDEGMGTAASLYDFTLVATEQLHMELADRLGLEVSYRAPDYKEYDICSEVITNGELLAELGVRLSHVQAEGQGEVPPAVAASTRPRGSVGRSAEYGVLCKRQERISSGRGAWGGGGAASRWA